MAQLWGAKPLPPEGGWTYSSSDAKANFTDEVRRYPFPSTGRQLGSPQCLRIRTPATARLARPLLAVGASLLVTGLVLSTFAAIAGPIAPAEACDPASLRQQQEPRLVTEGDEPSRRRPDSRRTTGSREADVQPRATRRLDARRAKATTLRPQTAEEPESDVPADRRTCPSTSLAAMLLSATDDRSFFETGPTSTRATTRQLVPTQPSSSRSRHRSTSTAGGESFFYTLTVTNSGTAAATGVDRERPAAERPHARRHADDARPAGPTH